MTDVKLPEEWEARLQEAVSDLWKSEHFSEAEDIARVMRPLLADLLTQAEASYERGQSDMREAAAKAVTIECLHEDFDSFYEEALNGNRPEEAEVNWAYIAESRIAASKIRSLALSTAPQEPPSKRELYHAAIEKVLDMRRIDLEWANNPELQKERDYYLGRAHRCDDILFWLGHIESNIPAGTVALSTAGEAGRERELLEARLDEARWWASGMHKGDNRQGYKICVECDRLTDIERALRRPRGRR